MTWIDQLRALREQATEGDWRAAFWPIPEPTHHVTVADPNPLSSKSLGPVCGPVVSEETARFIARAGNLWPALLDVVQAAEQAAILEHDPAKTDAQNAEIARRAKAFRDALARLRAEIR